MTYQINDSKPVPWRSLIRFAQSKGYKGAHGPYNLAAWLNAKGHRLYDVVGTKKYEVK